MYKTAQDNNMAANPFNPTQSILELSESGKDLSAIADDMAQQPVTNPNANNDDLAARADIMAKRMAAVEQRVEIIEETGELTVGNDSGGESEPDANIRDTKQFGYKVRLFAVRGFPNGDYVIFEATPTFSENRTVEYAQVAPVHLPGSIQVYKRTSSRTFSIGAKLISRNRSQATQNMKYLQMLRGWTMPYFGARDYTSGMEGNLTSTATEDANSMLGAPPDVLYLYAYSSDVGAEGDRDIDGGLINIKKVPVVITSLGITYPEDVDYIPVNGTNEPFPVKMDVTIELIETHSPSGYEAFSLKMFKTGQLVQF